MTADDAPRLLRRLEPFDVTIAVMAVRDTAERLAHSRALTNAFSESRTDRACAPLRQGIMAFPRLLHGDPEALDVHLNERWDTSVVPARWFERSDHFRIGFGRPTGPVEDGLARLGAGLNAFA